MALLCTSKPPHLRQGECHEGVSHALLTRIHTHDLSWLREWLKSFHRGRVEDAESRVPLGKNLEKVLVF